MRPIRNLKGSSLIRVLALVFVAALAESAQATSLPLCGETGAPSATFYNRAGYGPLLAPNYSGCLDFSAGSNRGGIYDFGDYRITFSFVEVLESFGMRVSAFQFPAADFKPPEVTSRFPGSFDPSTICVPLTGDNCVVFRVEKIAPQRGAQFNGDIGVDVVWYEDVPTGFGNPRLQQAPGQEDVFRKDITTAFCPNGFGYGEGFPPGCEPPPCDGAESCYFGYFGPGEGGGSPPVDAVPDAGIRGMTDNFSDFTVTATPVPEPGTFVLLAGGLAVGYRQLRRRRRSG